MKAFVVRLFLWYDAKFPVQRGKFRLAKWLRHWLGPVMLKTPDNIILEIYPTSQMDKSYFNDCDNGHAVIRERILDLRAGDVFIDVGANIGYFSILAARRVGMTGKVFAFEPSTREFERLRRAKSLNHSDNLTVYHLALSDAPGYIDLSVSEYHTGTNQIVNNSSAERKVERIASARLDDILPGQPINLVKIDVEGAELKILRGCAELLSKKLIKELVIEITPSFLSQFGDSKEELYSFLEKFGYVPIIKSTAWQFDEVFVQSN